MTAQCTDWFNSLPVDRAEELKLDFASEIDRAIRAAKLTRKEIAEKASVKPSWITKVLRGDVNLTIESIVKLAEAAGCDVTLAVRPRSETVIAKADVFRISDFRRHVTFRGAREAMFEIRKTSEISSNDMELVDAA